ncbi:MAG: hypothetical protein WEE89_23075 [Gemmatimonadota bacterium]
MNTRRYFIVLAAFLLTFAAGGASVYAARGLGARRVATGTLPQPFTELGLDSAQQARVSAIFAAYQPRTDSVITSLIPRLKGLADSMHAEILPILEPEQRAKLNAAQRPPTYLLKRRSGERVQVDTLRLKE